MAKVINLSDFLEKKEQEKQSIKKDKYDLAYEKIPKDKLDEIQKWLLEY